MPPAATKSNMAKISKSYILTPPRPPGACDVSEVWGTHKWTYSPSWVTVSNSIITQTLNTVESFIFVGLKFRGLQISDKLVGI